MQGDSDDIYGEQKSQYAVNLDIAGTIGLGKLPEPRLRKKKRMQTMFSENE